VLYIHLGNPDKAFKWLNKAAEEGAPWLMTLRTDPAFTSIRTDPRFAPLVRRSEVPPSWSSLH
jgi:hypothetical protein